MDKKYRLLLKILPEAFSYHQLLTDSRGTPVDYIFLNVNPAFETMTGLKKEQILGKRVTEVYPGILSSHPDWFDICDRVAAGGGDVRFESYFEPQQRWYEIAAYSDTPGYFAVVCRDITENKHFQKALQESEENLAITLQSIGDGVIATDLHGKVTRLNRQAEKLTGWTLTEAAGRPLSEIFQIVNARTGEKALNPVEHVLKTGETVKLANDTVLISRGGNRYQIADSAAPIRDSKGKISGVVMVFSDITEQYRARKKLEETTQRLEYILKATRTGIDIIDQNFNLQYVDNLWQSLYGPAAGRKCYDYFRSRQTPCENCGVPRALATKQVTLSEQTLPKEGNRIVECYAVPFQNEQGGWQVAGFKTDITKHKQLEEKLKNSEARYRTIVENINDALFIYDFQGKIVDLNETAHKMLGYARRELLGTNITLLLSPDEQRRYPERLEQLLEDEQLFFESTLLNKQGRPLPIEISTKLVSRKSPGLLQSFIRNITGRKQVEQKIASYTAELERLYHKLNKEMDKARQVHARTLPKDLPAVGGLSFAAHYQPAESLGGDLYNVERLGQKLVIYLSDVTGHGIDGAILSEFVKHTLKGYFTFSPEAGIRPEKILRYLSNQFQENNLPADYFICIFLAVLDLTTLELTYTAAGFQDAPLVRLGDGRCAKLESKGLFLSPAFSDKLLNLREKSLRLTPGTTIFFHTDGLSEQNAGDTYYAERLPALFYKNSFLPPPLLARIVREDFQRFNGGSLQGNDDITFLILQLDPNPQKTERLQLASDFAELKRLRARVSRLLGANKKANLFLACLHELTSNAIEHGNKFDRNKTVSIELVITDRFLQARIEDQGEGFNWRAGVNKPLELGGISERGRGITMARLCSQHLFYNDRGNQVTFIVKRLEEDSNRVH